MWKILFQRLQAAKTVKFEAGLVSFLSWFICKRSATAVQSSIDALQPGLFRMLIEQVWLPAMGTIKVADQQKLLAVATTQVIDAARMNISQADREPFSYGVSRAEQARCRNAEKRHSSLLTNLCSCCVSARLCMAPRLPHYGVSCYRHCLRCWTIGCPMQRWVTSSLT